MKKNNKYLVVVQGPTAVGKTGVCVELAKRWKCEVVSADSRQFYREMSIGTAKPTLEECDGVPHHFIDFLSVKDYYSVGLFEKDGMERLKLLFERYDVVLMTGGSGFYVEAVCEGIVSLPDVSEKVYEELEYMYREEGLLRLLEELAVSDPRCYAVIDKNNPRRVLRALAVCRGIGVPFSSFKQPMKKRPFEIVKVGLQRSREVLRERIGLRVDDMVSRGLMEEAYGLWVYKDFPALRTIGYQEFFRFFEGGCTVEGAIENIKVSTCQYLKRQMSWLRRDKAIRWFGGEDWHGLVAYLEEMIFS